MPAFKTVTFSKTLRYATHESPRVFQFDPRIFRFIFGQILRAQFKLISFIYETFSSKVGVERQLKFEYTEQ